MCQVKPGPRCACDAQIDLVRAQDRFRAAHPGQPLPDALRDAGTVAVLHARWQVARQDARLAQHELVDAQRRGHDAAYSEALASYRDGALSRALAAQEELTGVWQERETTRAEHLAKHGPSALAERADEPPVPVRTDAWDPKSGRHLVTGTKFDESGLDRQGFGRDQRDALGYHRQTGTLLSPSGHLPDGRHVTQAGLSYEQATLPTADDVIAGKVELEPVSRRTSASKAIADAKKADRNDVRPAKAVAAPAAWAAPAGVPFKTKGQVATALREPGSRWSIERGGTVTPVTVVRSSTTSIWVQPDEATEGEKPIWLPIGDRAAWNVLPDGFDEDGQTRVRRLAA